ncbi:GIY-YIG nuclease family protein [Candidatus Falkowbacteria bacterium]|nr:GIY-YIG nuclease family protein [Candidatus Falkowbacteria bacterium]
MKGIVYILKSIKNQKHYIGSTTDLERRISEHNKGIGGKFTKMNGPWKVICYKELLTIDDARKEEKLIKSYKGGNAFKKIIYGEVPEWLKGAPC